MPEKTKENCKTCAHFNVKLPKEPEICRSCDKKSSGDDRPLWKKKAG